MIRILYDWDLEILEFLVIFVLALLYTGFVWLRRKYKRLKKNGWKHVPLPKWRGELAEVRAYLEEGGMQNVRYSPDEGISGYALSGAKCLDSFSEGESSHCKYISGLYKEWPVQLSAVLLEQVDEDEAMRAAVRLGSTGSTRYVRSGFYTYFSGTWYIFRVKRKLQGDLFFVDRRLGDKDGRHGPGKHTTLPRISLGWRLSGQFDCYGSDVDPSEVEQYLTDDLQTLLLRLHEKYRLFILITGSKVHIGIEDQKHLFRHREEETVEDWREKQTLFETLDDLTQLVSHFGTPPSEDEYFF
jgi:hypothetical protein